MHPSHVEPLLAHWIIMIGMPRASVLSPKKKSSLPATAVKSPPTMSIKRLHIGKATAVTPHACLLFLVHLAKSPVIVALTMNVPTDAVKPSAKVQGWPMGDETRGFPPVCAATTVRIEQIIHPA